MNVGFKVVIKVWKNVMRQNILYINVWGNNKIKYSSNVYVIIVMAILVGVSGVWWDTSTQWLGFMKDGDMVQVQGFNLQILLNLLKIWL